MYTSLSVFSRDSLSEKNCAKNEGSESWLKSIKHVQDFLFAVHVFCNAESLDLVSFILFISAEMG